MVADDVEIVTSSPDEPLARRMSLRSVHGKYLIRLLDKELDEEARRVGPHGTSVRLKIRASAEDVAVKSALNQWIWFPNCSIIYCEDKSEPINIGYEGPKALLEAFMSSQEGAQIRVSREYRILEKRREGIELAYVVIWSPIFRDWSFLSIPQDRESYALTRVEDEQHGYLFGTCVEGIAVEFGTPGFESYSIVAAANATGVFAPRTDVARSTLEDTPERVELIRKVYQMFVEQINDEVNRLTKEEGYSASWARCQIPFLAEPFVSGRSNSLMRRLRVETLEDVPMYLVEDGKGRRSASLSELSKSNGFVTIESELSTSAERVVRGAPVEITLRQLMGAWQQEGDLPNEQLVCNLDRESLALEIAQTAFEIESVELEVVDRRLVLSWREQRSPGRRVVSIEQCGNELYRSDPSLYFALGRSVGGRRQGGDNINICVDVVQTGCEKFAGFEAHGGIYTSLSNH
jgi:hypothetical protein